MITIDPYNSNWPALFEEEAASIRAAMSSLAMRIDHVGSTSVPKLAAKPVIDIQVSVASLDPMALYSELLAQLGYIHTPLGPFDLAYPFFQKPEACPSTHHVHLCVFGGEQERRHLAFRDHLRRHPEIAAEYEGLKHSLAAVHDGTTLESRERYSLSKSKFVNSVLKHALSAGNAAEEAP